MVQRLESGCSELHRADLEWLILT